MSKPASATAWPTNLITTSVAHSRLLSFCPLFSTSWTQIQPDLRSKPSMLMFKSSIALAGKSKVFVRAALENVCDESAEGALAISAASLITPFRTSPAVWEGPYLVRSAARCPNPPAKGAAKATLDTSLLRILRLDCRDSRSGHIFLRRCGGRCRFAPVRREAAASVAS